MPTLGTRERVTRLVSFVAMLALFGSMAAGAEVEQRGE